MRRLLFLLGLAALGCTSAPTLPDGFDQRTSPETAFISFQAAVAAEDHDREFEYLSEPMRRRFGVRARTDWKDARAAVLTQRHIAIRGILMAELQGTAPLEDGRVRLDVVAQKVISFAGTVIMRPQAVLRVRVAGDPRPRVYLDLADIVVAPGPGMLAVMVPEDWREILADELSGEEITMVQAQVEWFVDDFALGDDTADAVAVEVTEKKKKK